MKSFVGSVCLLLFACCAPVTGDECFPEHFSGSSSVVCVCSSANCSELGVVEAQNGSVVLYQTSMDGQRFRRQSVDFVTSELGDKFDLTVELLNRTLQRIIGFGAAFTDSAGINWAGLDERLRQRLVASYYGAEGLEYNMARVPMAGCDFSVRDYSYDDVDGDFELKNFSLAKEDFSYKIPMMQLAKQMSKQEVYFFGSPWSAPGWMKTNRKTYGMGALRGAPGQAYYKAWANYFVKFYEAYKQQGIEMWGFTLQNEPTTGFLPWKWQTMAMSPYTQRDFLKLDLGPALFNATSGQINIMVLDDSRLVLPWWANVIFRDPVANSFAAGVAVHWYTDSFRSSSALQSTHKSHPEKFIINTEACEGFQPWATAVILGSWERAEAYAQNIIDDLRHSLNGWLDWNLCLDTQGGPNWVKNFVDSPIIVNSNEQKFYKQPMYYALAHFTKFIPRGSVRIDDVVHTSKRNLMVASFLRPDKLKTAVILNKNNSPVKVLVKDANGKSFVVNVAARSIVSTLW